VNANLLGNGRRKIGDFRPDQRMPARQVARVTWRILDGGHERHCDYHCMALADKSELRSAAEPLGGEPVLEGFRLLYRLVVDADHHVARLEARASGRAFFMHVLDQRTAWAVEPKRFSEVLGYRLERRAEPRPLHRAALQRGLNHEPHHVGRNRKSNALRPAAAREDGGAETDEAAIPIA